MRDKLSCVADSNEVADGKKRSATGWNPRSTQSRDVVWWLNQCRLLETRAFVPCFNCRSSQCPLSVTLPVPWAETDSFFAETCKFTAPLPMVITSISGADTLLLIFAMWLSSMVTRWVAVMFACVSPVPWHRMLASFALICLN